MVRVATVFSGIGAIEHALVRMGIDHKIVFACDNGDVDILVKHIDQNIDTIHHEIENLNNELDKIKNNEFVDDIYQEQILNMSRELDKQYQDIILALSIINEKNSSILSVLKKIVEMENIKSIRYKEYNKFIKTASTGSLLQQRLRDVQLIQEVINDFKKDNSLNSLYGETSFNSRDNINWEVVSKQLLECYEYFERNNGKNLIKSVQDISQRISQLYEKVNYLEIQEHLDSFNHDWHMRKRYVDNLYSGLEKKNKVRTSYLANYDLDEDDFHWNVAFLNGEQYRNEVDLFVGGSPCQSFSLVGKQRGLEDTRGTLFYEYARLVKEIQPKIFIYENVRSVLTHDSGKTWRKMQEVFNQLGYTYYDQVLNAKNYGVPQNRERVFVIGFRNDIAPLDGFSFPAPVELNKTMKDYLLDNVPGGYFLPEKGAKFVTSEKNLKKRFTQIDGDVQLCQKKNQQYNWHGDFVFQSEEEAKKNNIPNLEKYFLSEKVKKYVLSTGTKNFYSRPKTDLDIARPLLTTMHKMHRAGVDNYVTTDGRLRKLTPRECLRLMGFTDDFKIVVADTPMYQQAGNSIVVDVLIAILQQLHIEEYGDCE